MEHRSSELSFSAAQAIRKLLLSLDGVVILSIECGYIENGYIEIRIKLWELGLLATVPIGHYAYLICFCNF